MEISISVARLTVDLEYDISTEMGLWSARAKGDAICIFDASDRNIGSLSQTPHYFQVEFTIELQNGDKYKLTRQKLWEGVYACKSEKNEYTIFTHRGNNYSIFNLDVQIASFAHNPLVIADGDKFLISANYDADPVLLACIVIAMDLVNDTADSGVVAAYDFGNIGPEARPFDANWKPKLHA